jgi:Protein phosphatase 2C
MLAWTEQKKGNSPEENEDAFAADLDRGRFAIADGATESSDAAVWARILVDAFVENGCAMAGGWADAQPALQARWMAAVAHTAMPWYAEIKRQEGAFATFLGLTLEGAHWQAVAVGDSCLFHVRGQQMLAAFPLQHWIDFTTTPCLVGSRNASAECWERHVHRCEGDLAPGDGLWLMTDALAAWFLKGAEAGQRPWELLEGFFNVADAEVRFTNWTAALRDSGDIRNDDVTLVGVLC